MFELQLFSCSLVYFGGYGHKLFTDVNRQSRNFIVDESSWVRLVSP